MQGTIFKLGSHAGEAQHLQICLVFLLAKRDGMFPTGADRSFELLYN